MPRNKSIFPLLFLLLALLTFVAWQYDGYLFADGDEISAKKQNVQKINEVLGYVQNYYVDDVDWNKSMNGAIKGMLETLDPHSVYFTAEEARQNEENFQGRYEGIGIHYDVIESYLTVISVIPGSPSEEAGLMAGDRIIMIDNVSAYGINSTEVPAKLKGPKGTPVKVTVAREGFDEPIEFTLIRDEIPIFTVNTYFMADEITGYIWLNRFASTTADEVETALITLEKQGMKRLLLDLRGNGGGYLRQAVEIVGKFIDGHDLVVYTKGRLPRYDEEYFTDDFGSSIKREYPLVILIDHGSASASEIVAGAIQDYDRGLIVGTNSFGKGLVQNEFVLNDDSKLRLTVSKYYTPSGRLIQRPYKDKNIGEYYTDLNYDDERLDSTKSVTDDSVKERPVYTTKGGRSVFGGGGITPDTIVVYKSYSKSPKMTQKFLQKRIFFEVAAHFANHNTHWKDRYADFLKDFKVDPDLLLALRSAAEKKNIKFSGDEFQNDEEFLKIRLKAEIARTYWGVSSYWQVFSQYDNQFQTAVKLFPESIKLAQLGQSPQNQK